jgi:hypothetical protein
MCQQNKVDTSLYVEAIHNLARHYYMAAPQSRSRFYGDESDDDDDDVSVNSVNVPVPGRQNRFQLEESDSESEDEGRVVRTEKDKKFEAINTFITAIRNQLRQNNWVETIDGASNHLVGISPARRPALTCPPPPLPHLPSISLSPNLPISRLFDRF